MFCLCKNFGTHALNIFCSPGLHILRQTRSRVGSREGQQTQSRDEASHICEKFEQSGILNLMRRRCAGRLTEVYKVMKVVDWVTAGLYFTQSCSIRGTC